MGNREDAPDGDTRPVARALALVADGLEELLYATGTGTLARSELLAALRGLEVARRKIPAIEHQLLTQCADEGVAGELGEKNLTALLHHTLRISQADARARIRAAERLGPRRAVTGEPLEPQQATVASAQYAGLINTRHATIIDQFLTKIPSAAGPEVRERAERVLTEQALMLTPEQLQAVGHRLLAHVDPDGRLTDDRDRRRRRSLGVGRQGVDLMSPLGGTLAPTCRAKLDTVLAKLARPGAATDPEGALTDRQPDPDAIHADTRSQSQRNHDALEAVLDMALASGRLGEHRGLPTTVIITMTLGQLETAAGQATTASGGVLPITDALHLAERAHPVLTVFDHTGRPLHLGRGKRLATTDQRLALIAADRGCTRPGCTAPPDRCEVHHTNEWADGGPTDIDQLTLACDGDHALISGTRVGGQDGWKTTIGAHRDYPGRCAWTAPTHLDPRQQPQINHTHHPEELLGGDEDPP